MKKYPEVYQKIWGITGSIPRGEVRSYRWVASKLGNPGSARLVGRALKANPSAPAVPCHRVVRSDGSLGGYSGGILKKISLLRKEGVALRRLPEGDWVVKKKHGKNRGKNQVLE